VRILKKLVVLVGFVLLVASGCGSEKTMTCTRTMDQNGMKADLRYEVNYKGSTVSKVKSTGKGKGFAIAGIIIGIIDIVLVIINIILKISVIAQ